MRIRRLLSICCTAALVGSVFTIVPPAQAATPTFSRTVTISSPYTATGSINPAAFVDASVAPFNVGGPFTVTGYYRFNKMGDHNRGTGDTPSATVFDVPVSDTNGQWKSFTSSFSSASGFAPKGLVLWYMAGELSVADIVIKNAAGTVVYNLATDSQLNWMASGWRIFSTELFSSSKPMSKISMATTRPERYSIRP